jgi:hypothetical protein
MARTIDEIKELLAVLTDAGVTAFSETLADETLVLQLVPKMPPLEVLDPGGRPLSMNPTPGGWKILDE